MADKQFQYIINAELKLNTGSLKSVISQIGQLDKNIKDHYGSKGGGVKVPLTVDKDISKFQGELKRVIEGYNKGQAPTIKIPIAPDESSIKKLQERISQVKKQLNSLSDEKSISINTSLKVGKDEKANIQRQIDDTNASIVVGLRLNDEDIKKVQSQIEHIKAEVKATVTAVQTDAERGARRFYSARPTVVSPTNSVGNTSRQTSNSINNQQAKRDFAQAHEYYTNQEKLLKEQIKGEQELNHLRDELERAQKPKKARKTDKMTAYGMDGSKTPTTVTEYTKQLEDELRKQEKLQHQLNRNAQAIEISRQKMGQQGLFMPSQGYKSISNSKSKPTEQQKTINKITQAEINKAIREKEQQDKDMERLYAHLSDMNKRPSSYYDVNHDAKQGIAKNSANKAMKDQIAKSKQEAKELEQQQKDLARVYASLYEMDRRDPATFNPNYDAIQGIQKARAQKAMANQASNAKAQAKAQAQQVKDAQNKSDHDSHLRRWGGNKEYSATDLEAMLLDPNIGLAESMQILKTRINPVNQAQAVAMGSNFQKAHRINYTDGDGNLRTINTMVTQYTKFGEVIERGDRSFSQMMSHIASKTTIFSALEFALASVSMAFVKGVEDMARFDAQMAEVIATTQQLTGTGTKLQDFYSTVGGTSSMQSQVQNDTFSNAEKYGVSALDTVMPIEQQVLARQGLVAGKNGKYDASVKNQIVKNIMEFSAISTNGQATPEETNDLTKDALSLYQAYYNPDDPNQHLDKMNGVFDNLSAMKMRGVNTTSVADAMAELAPDTITAGVDSKQVMAMLGGYNLADASATGDDIQTIGRTFFSAIRHADTNSNLKEALKNYMGIDLSSQTMSTPDLINRITKDYGNLNDKQREAFAGAFAGTSGKGTAMTPKMIKFLDATQGSDYKNFMNQDTSGAMAKSWIPFSEKLKTNFDGLVEKLQEFVQLIGRLGVLDSLGLLVSSFSKLLDLVNGLLRGVQSLSDVFGNHDIFNIPKFTTEILALTMAWKGLTAVLNKKGFGGAVGDFMAGKFGGRTLGIKTSQQRIESELVRSGATPELIASIMPQIGNRTTSVVAQDAEKIATQSAERAVAQTVATEAVSKSTGRKVVGSVGSFMSDALFLSYFKNRGAVGVAEEGAKVASQTSIWAKFSEWIISILPALRTFGLLLTRLSLIGGALALGSIGYNAIQKDMDKQNSEAIKNANNNFKVIAKDPKKRDQTVEEVQAWIDSNNKVSGMDMQTRRLTQTGRLNDNFAMKNKWNLVYHGSGKNATIDYQDKNKKTHTAHVSNKDEINALIATFKNAGLNDVQKLSDAWDVSTDSMKKYSDELAMVNTLSKNLSVTMNQISTGQKELDAKYGGITSSASLQEKIGLTQNGLNKSQSDIQTMSKFANDITGEYNKTNNDYSAQVNKALGTGLVSQDDIQQAIMALEVAKAGGQSAGTVFGNYTPLDDSDSKDRQTIKDKKMSKKDVENYNTKNDAITSVLKIYQALMSARDLSNSGQDSMNQVLSQQYQYQESLKQMQSQQIIAKLGLDALSASITQLGAVASASKTLVSIATNTLQTGDNSKQISALSSSAHISVSQMSLLTQQKNSVESAMADLKRNNPNQDFSINNLYNPSGNVSSEQLAYKSLYEQSQQITESISNQSNQMYEQLQQMKDLVLNSTKYADSWQRIQDTVTTVKEALKSTSDFQYQIGSVNENAQLTSALTGQNFYDVKSQSLDSLRDNSLQLATKLNTLGKSNPDDLNKMNQAWNDITQQMGSMFQQSMVNPLKDIMSSMGSSNSAFGSSVGSFNSAVNNFANTVNQAKSIPTGSGVPSSLPSGTPSGGVGVGGDPTKITVPSGPVVDSINQIFAGTQLHDYGAVYADIASQYGIDPRLMAAISMAETGGNSSALNNKNNVGGIFHGGSLASYTSIYNSVEDLAKILKNMYFDQGLNTIPSIQSKYAPYNADNDPNHLNDNWRNNVSSYYSKMTGISQSQLLGGSAISQSSGGGGGGGYGGGGSSATTTANLWLHSSPDANSSSRIKLLPKGSSWQTYGEQNGFVNLGSGWVSAQYLTGNFNSAGGGGGGAPSSGAGGGVSGMFNWLNSVKGNTNAMSYVWGGAHQMEDWSTFLNKAIADCSGLVENVYRQFAGINLGTTSSQGIYNSDQGQRIDKSQLQAGDLVFFGSNTSSIHHVGIYAGNGQDYAIDDSGLPVSLDNTFQADYIGAKHFNIAGGNPLGAPTQADINTPKTDTIIDSAQASIAKLKSIPDALNFKLDTDLTTVQAHGNITDVMGTSGVTGGYDRIIQARQDIADQKISNKNQMDSALGERNYLYNLLQQASSSGDTTGYNTYKAEYDAFNQLISALQDNTKGLDQLDATYASWQQNDPRNNYGVAQGIIKGGLDKLNGYVNNGQAFSTDYNRVVNEVNGMFSTYDTHQKNADALSQLFGRTGEQTSQFVTAKGLVDQDNINLIYTQIQNINGVLNQFVQGTQAWFTTLNESAKVEQQLHDLEQQRLSDAKTMFSLTGQGLNGYIYQKAYTQSKDYSQNYQNLANGLQNYKNGTMPTGGFGLQTGEYESQAQAQGVAGYLLDTYGVKATVNDLGFRGGTQVGTVAGNGVNVYSDTTGSGNVTEALPNNGKYIVYGEQNGYYNVGNAGWVKTSDMTGIHHNYNVTSDTPLTSDATDKINKDLKDKGMTFWQSKTDSSGMGALDFNQQLANLQIIADAHNAMTQQMNDYKQAVVDGFKAGAMSIDDYISKMNQLRDVQTEQKDNAVNMVDNMHQGFQGALSDALTQGMQGSLNSPLSFMNSIKQTLSSSISGQLSQTLLQNTGLQDVMNKLISNFTNASTTGNPNDIVNMFKNNDFGKQINDTLQQIAPFIQQIVGSTQGIFTILKDQVYNAPSGFKIDNYMNEIANRVGYQGIKTMNPNVNDVGSPNGNFPDTGPIQTTPPSQIPSGVPPTTSGSGTTPTGPPEGTTGNGTGAPDPSGGMNLPAVPPQNVPGPPSSSPPPTTSVGGSAQTVRTTANVWLHSSPDANQSSRIRLLPAGTSWLAYSEQNGFINLGGNQWVSAQYVTGWGGGGSGGGGVGGAIKHVRTALNFRSSAGYGNNVMSVIPQGGAVTYYGMENGWAKVGYGGRTGYVGSQYLYHTGGIAGITNFASAQGLKPNELSAILQKSETIFQPKQLDDLVNGAMQAGSNTSSGGGINLTVNVNIDGGGNYDKAGIEAVVETAVTKAMSEFKKNTRMNNLSWKGTSY